MAVVTISDDSTVEGPMSKAESSNEIEKSKDDDAIEGAGACSSKEDKSNEGNTHESLFRTLAYAVET